MNYPKEGWQKSLVHVHLACKQDHLEETAMHTTSIVQAPSLALSSGITIPDSKMAREVTELVRDTESSLLFNHSSRVYYFSAATGKRKGLTFDPELLYVSAMFHDLGLTPKHSSATDRFEVDGANTAREFLRQHKIPSKTSTQCGLRLPFTPHPVSLSTCIRWLRY